MKYGMYKYLGIRNNIQTVFYENKKTNFSRTNFLLTIPCEKY